MGDRDYVKPILEAMPGATVHFGRLNMKPGKPTTFATVTTAPTAAPSQGRVVLVFALPGNPVSAWVGAHTLIVPAIRGMARRVNVLGTSMPTASSPSPSTAALAAWHACLPPKVTVSMLDGVAVSTMNVSTAKRLTQLSLLAVGSRKA
jgi:molybdopterin biosynthesis enzyme